MLALAMLHGGMRKIERRRCGGAGRRAGRNRIPQVFLTTSPRLDDDAVRSLGILTMRLIVTLVAATCLSVHTLLGCCWHHLWNDDSCCAVAEVAHAAHSHEHCHAGCCEDPSHQQHPDEPCPCNSECRGTCNYLPTGKAECQTPSFAGYMVIPAGTASGIDLPNLTATYDLAHIGPHAALPMRLHLLHQVLQV